MSELKGNEYSMIRSMKLAGFLMYNGFKLINVGQNKDFPTKKVFWFPNSEELVLAIIRYNELRGERTKNDGRKNDNEGGEEAIRWRDPHL